MELLEERVRRLEKKQEGVYYRKSISLTWMTWFFVLYNCWNFYFSLDIHDTIAKFINMFFLVTLIRDTLTISFQKKYFVKE